MKKVLFLISASIVFTSLIACNYAGTSGNSNQDMTSNNSAETSGKKDDYTIPQIEFTEDEYPVTTSKPSYSQCISYEDYGAKGDGVTDDSDAIFAAHECANSKGLPVKAKSGAKYLIKKQNNKTAIIKTDTDWTGAEFIVDDSELPADTPRARSWAFSVRDGYSATPILLVDTITTAYASKQKAPEMAGKNLSKDASNIGMSLSGLTSTKKSVLLMQNQNVVRFRRCQSGRITEEPAQEDTIVVDSNGNIDSGTPLNWSYNGFTKIYCRPVPEKTLYITGGTFTTIVNRCTPVIYVSGGIEVLRSNVVIDGVNHKLENEGTPSDYSSPYYGIFYLKQCAYITIKNCRLSSHITYANRCGTYDIYPLSVDYLTIFNCHEYTDLCDFDRWGIIGSNFCKNVRILDSELSRFDGHKGVTNVYIKNSTIGWAGINLIGEGTFRMENSKCYGANFIRLREDFGSTWHGNIYIKDCDWYITRSDGRQFSSSMACVIGGNHICNFDFGYDCYMPKKIFIDGFTIHDENKAASYNGPYLLNDFLDSTVEYFNSVKAQHPFYLTEDIYVRNFDSSSTDYSYHSDKVSPNTDLFKDVTIHTSWSSAEEN